MLISTRVIKHARLLTIALLLVFTLTGAIVGLALANEGDPSQPGSPPLDDPHLEADVSACAGCHASVVGEWTGGPHALAFSNDAFQSAWQAADQDGTCLECHTTNYVPSTGEYEAEGIACQECHGEIPANHPEEPVSLDQANRVCANCHTVANAEFRASLHEARGLTCTSCHYAHSNGLRLGTEVEQCLRCHGNQLDDFAHASHLQVDDLTCRSCHGYVQPGTFEQRPDGQTPTGHDFQERVTACVDCHEDIELVPVDGGEANSSMSTTETQQMITAGQEAQLRVVELQNALQTLQQQYRTHTALSVIGGGAGGLLAGGVVVSLILRRRNGNGKNNMSWRD